MKKLQKGFTLIELLVVVAIIGILATVVLASLGSARSRAKDAAAKAAASQIRAEMELMAPGNGVNGYREGASGSVCLTTAATKFLTAARAQVGTANADCFATVNTYSMEVLLNSGKYFCVDSSGFAGELSAAAGALAASGRDQC